MDLTALPAMAALGLLVFHLVRAFEEVSRIRETASRLSLFLVFIEKIYKINENI